MNAEKWKKVAELYEAALELPAEKQRGFVRDACAGDGELCREVESMLQAREKAGSFLGQLAAEQIGISLMKPASLLGKQLGVYAVEKLIGAGGMGEVYRARDTKLRREVALKVLPAEYGADRERAARLEREARMLAALNHPNIAAIYSLEEWEGQQILVMELAEGETLAQKLRKGPLPLEESLQTAFQIAEALAAAHEKQIVHRDLKPANVKVTPQGKVKVLDFGLAKAWTGESGGVDLSGERKLTASWTEEGMLVGTPAYMSPEQVRGERVDKGTDIWAFGCLLYEMLTAKKAFSGKTISDTAAEVLKGEPDWPALPGSTPNAVRKILERCLRKEASHRLRDIGDARIEMVEILTDLKKLVKTDNAVHPTGPTATIKRQRVWIWGAGAVLVILFFLGFWQFHQRKDDPETAPTPIPLTSYPGSELLPSFSPDGNQVAFCWNGKKQDNYDIYVKLLDADNFLPLTTNSADDLSPAWSPDNRWIAFCRDLSGGKYSILLISPIGGPEHFLIEITSPIGMGLPYLAWHPNGKWLAVSDQNSPSEAASIFLFSVESGEKRRLTSPPQNSYGDGSPAFSPDGTRLAFSRQVDFSTGDLYMLAITENLAPNGEPILLAPQNGDSRGKVWTPDGLQIIYTIKEGIKHNLYRLNARASMGKVSRPEQLLLPGPTACDPTISKFWRGGNYRLAYTQENWDRNIWRLPLSANQGSTASPVPFIASTQDDWNPQFSPDGKHIAFASNRGGDNTVWVSDANGLNCSRLVVARDAWAGTPRWSPDGQRIAFDWNVEGNFDVYLINVRGGSPLRITTEPVDNAIPSWSQDGNSIYFTSKRTGPWQVWKVSVDQLGTPSMAVQVTRNGGHVAFESLDGKYLYYTKDETLSKGLWRMPVSGGVESQILNSVYSRNFSVAEKGIYFISEPDREGKFSIQFYDFSSRKVKKVAALPGVVTLGLSVSPDGRWILYTQSDQEGSDLMLVENFK